MDQTNESNVEDITMLQHRYNCPSFRILIIGRANAGKTTILEKVCGAKKGARPIIYNENDEPLMPSEMHLMPSAERGMHNIEHQITYPGSNFIFHDSEGFEAGAIEEIENLHVIWYCIPMDGPRPLLDAELQFFSKGTGKVPLVTIFTKFDGQIIQEYGKLDDREKEDKWDKAKENAEVTFQRVYLPKVLNTEHPPRSHVRLQDMDIPESNCPELTEKTADVIDNISLYQLFVSTQMNNLDLCVRAALKYALDRSRPVLWDIFFRVLCRFPHYWVDRDVSSDVLDTTNWTLHGKGKLKLSLFGHDIFHNYYNLNTRRFSEILNIRSEILLELSPLFGGANPTTRFSNNATCCRILIAIIIIVKKSFWIKKPIHQAVADAYKEFKHEGYPKKLVVDITSVFIPSKHEDLLAYLYDYIIHI